MLVFTVFVCSVSQATFKAIDKNNDGAITKEELVEALKNSGKEVGCQICLVFSGFVLSLFF